ALLRGMVIDRGGGAARGRRTRTPPWFPSAPVWSDKGASGGRDEAGGLEIRFLVLSPTRDLEVLHPDCARRGASFAVDAAVGVLHEGLEVRLAETCGCTHQDCDIE